MAFFRCGSAKFTAVVQIHANPNSTITLTGSTWSMVYQGTANSSGNLTLYVHLADDYIVTSSYSSSIATSVNVANPTTYNVDAEFTATVNIHANAYSTITLRGNSYGYTYSGTTDASGNLTLYVHIIDTYAVTSSYSSTISTSVYVSSATTYSVNAEFTAYIRVNGHANAYFSTSGAGSYGAYADGSGNATITVHLLGSYTVSSNQTSRVCTATVSSHGQYVDAVYRWSRYYIKPLYTYVDQDIPTTQGSTDYDVYSNTGGRVSSFIGATAYGTQAHEPQWTQGKPKIGFNADDGSLYVISGTSFWGSDVPEGTYNRSGDINTNVSFSFLKAMDSGGKVTAIAQAWERNSNTDWDYPGGYKNAGDWLLNLHNKYSASGWLYTSSYFYAYQYSSTHGSYIDEQYAHAISAYPDNYMQNGFWYIAA